MDTEEKPIRLGPLLFLGMCIGPDRLLVVPLQYIYIYYQYRDTTIQRMTIRRMLIERHFWLHC